MQWHPMIQAGFCLKIKVFNYTRCFDKMALTSCSVSLYEQDRNGSTQKDVVANSGASKWMSNQQSTCIPIGYECFCCFFCHHFQPICAWSAGDHMMHNMCMSVECCCWNVWVSRGVDTGVPKMTCPSWKYWSSAWALFTSFMIAMIRPLWMTTCSRSECQRISRRQ